MSENVCDYENKQVFISFNCKNGPVFVVVHVKLALFSVDLSTTEKISEVMAPRATLWATSGSNLSV